MVRYKNQELILVKPKTEGKNLNDVNGIYTDPQGGSKYVVKKPDDKCELFAELFAGLILTEFKKRNLIDEVYFSSLICVNDVIQFEDGSYGLIQPFIPLNELHKIIGTSYRDGSDRDPAKEALFGPAYYTNLTKNGMYFGLSTSLLFSLLIGAHSVHSGNIAVLKGKGTSQQFGRLDWGDAFRNFATELNNANILYAAENRGFLNIKSITKDYFLNYKKIKGMYPAMADKATQLQEQITLQTLPASEINSNYDLLADIVSSALKNIPADLIDEQIKAEFAEYIALDSFKTVALGSDNSNSQFAAEMSKVLSSRLKQIAGLKDLLEASESASMYESIIGVLPITLNFNASESFSGIMDKWAACLSKYNERSTVDVDLLDLSKLTIPFQTYLNGLADECDRLNVWKHDSTSSMNMFHPYHSEIDGPMHGHAYVPQYKESTVLRNLFSIDLQTLNFARFNAYETPCNSYVADNKDSPWTKIQSLMSTAQGMFNILAMIKKTKEFGMDEVCNQNIELLKEHLTQFKIMEDEVKKVLISTAKDTIPNQDSSYFYPMAPSDLEQMSGDQLATICLEELNSSTPSSLVEYIMKQDSLWLQINESFLSGVFDGRLDNPKDKISKINEWRQLMLTMDVQDPSYHLLRQKILDKTTDELALMHDSKSADTSKVIAHEDPYQGYQFGDISRGLLKMVVNRTSGPGTEIQETQVGYQFGDISRGLLAMVAPTKTNNPVTEPVPESKPIQRGYKFGDYTRSFFGTKTTISSTVRDTEPQKEVENKYQ